jgi:hypothetical protein
VDLDSGGRTKRLLDPAVHDELGRHETSRHDCGLATLLVSG